MEIICINLSLNICYRQYTYFKKTIVPIQTAQSLTKWLLTKTIIMNKSLLLAGIALVVVSKAIVLKSILVDLSAYQRCQASLPISSPNSCGTDPLLYFILGWSVTAVGFILLVIGLRMPSVRTISR
jgi:hypothetical protein